MRHNDETTGAAKCKKTTTKDWMKTSWLKKGKEKSE